MPPRIPLPPRAAFAVGPAFRASEAPALAIRIRREACPRAFSTTPPLARITTQRRKFGQWLERRGADFKISPKNEQEHRYNNFLPSPMDHKRTEERAGYPFPLNDSFRAQAVLDESARDLIWKKVMVAGESIKSVSAELGVDQRRVAAVVRLKEVERSWVASGKWLAIPYARAVLAMLPQTRYTPGQLQAHEPINEIQVHSRTMQQLFVPVSESRQFTRTDAAKAFGPKMLSADQRVPHPELIQREKDVLSGMSLEESHSRFLEAATASERSATEAAAQKVAELERRTKRVRSDRFEFRFTDINVDDAGRDGRNKKATGWRYGVPSYDRKRGEVKIPTSVE